AGLLERSQVHGKIAVIDLGPFAQLGEARTAGARQVGDNGEADAPVDEIVDRSIVENGRVVGHRSGSERPAGAAELPEAEWKGDEGDTRRGGQQLLRATEQQDGRGTEGEGDQSEGQAALVLPRHRGDADG